MLKFLRLRHCESANRLFSSEVQLPEKSRKKVPALLYGMVNVLSGASSNWFPIEISKAVFHQIVSLSKVSQGCKFFWRLLLHESHTCFVFHTRESTQVTQHFEFREWESKNTKRGAAKETPRVIHETASIFFFEAVIRGRLWIGGLQFWLDVRRNRINLNVLIGSFRV